MIFKQAIRECEKVGTNHASGDALRAMYAKTIAMRQGGDVEKYYKYLQATGDDETTIEDARELLRDREKALDVLMGLHQNA